MVMKLLTVQKTMGKNYKTWKKIKKERKKETPEIQPE